MVAPDGDRAAERRDGAVRRALARWREWARRLKRETYAVYLALRDPGLPWHARLVAILVVGYAFSPIDLIPDFIPVFGYLDDLIIVPTGILLALRMIPPGVMAECRVRSREAMSQGKPVNRVAAALIIGVWLLLAALVIVLAIRIINR